MHIIVQSHARIGRLQPRLLECAPMIRKKEF
jgi:hypothetical protein